MRKTTRQRKSKTDLLKRGLKILAGQGVEGVTIDALCTGLGGNQGIVLSSLQKQGPISCGTVRVLDGGTHRAQESSGG